MILKQSVGEAPQVIESTQLLEIPITERTVARHLEDKQALRISPLLSGSNICYAQYVEEKIPRLLAGSGKARRPSLAAFELWADQHRLHNDRKTEQKRVHAIAGLVRTQRHLPDVDRVIGEILALTAEYFNAEGASLLLKVRADASTVRIRKFYRHYEQRKPVEFTADKGYSYKVIKERVALLIAKTDDSQRLAHGFAFSPSDIAPGKGKPTSMSYFLAPETFENEKSLILTPIEDLRDSRETLGVLKVGNLSRSNAFTPDDLIDLGEFASAIGGLIYAVSLGEERETIVQSLGIKSDWSERIEGLIMYHGLTLEVFHQVNTALDLVDAQLLLLSAETQDQQALELAQECKVAVRGGKNLLMKATSRGKDWGYIEAEHSLIEDILRPAIDRAQKRAGPQFNIDTKLGSQEYAVLVDKEFVQEAIFNVLNNAIWAVNKRHARPDTKFIVIVVEYREQDEKIAVIVEDNGVGIEANHQKRIFEAFFTTRGRSGTGLGLHMAKRVLTRTGGDIELLRSAPEKGSKFAIYIPGIPR